MPDQGSASEPLPAVRAGLSVVEAPETDIWPTAIALPTEEVTLLRVPLPLATHRQRLAAVGYAVEDLIAAPLDSVHVALGPELGPGEYLVVVLARDRMAAWAAKTGPTRKRLVPDVLALPVPNPGDLSVREAAGRILARRADGTGFATRGEAFETFWRIEGRPQVVLFGGRLPDAVPVSTSGQMPWAAPPDALSLDLMQGQLGRDSRRHRTLWQRLAAVAGIALLAHLGILGAKTFALQRIAAERETELRAQLASRIPGLPEGTPLDLALRRALPTGQEGDPGGFTPLAARVSEALLPTVGSISVRNMTFTAQDGSLSILVEGPDLETLQQVEGSLAAAGLTVEMGVATTSDGLAEVRYMIWVAKG